MSMSDIGWRRLLYVGAGLSIFASAIMTFVVIPQGRPDTSMTLEPAWVYVGIQIFFAAVLFGFAYTNKRDSRLTRGLLITIGIFEILLGLLMLYMVSTEQPDISLFWKAIRVCALDEIIIGIIALIACI
jgi:hypothetical protein